MSRPTYDPRLDAYAILHIAPHAHPDVVTAAYRALVKVYHPDAGGKHDAMVDLNNAYDLLKDIETRRAYDADREAEMLAYRDALGEVIRPRQTATAAPVPGEMRMPFGKHRGLPLSSLPDDYIEWLLTEANLRSPSLVTALEREWERRGFD